MDASSNKCCSKLDLQLALIRIYIGLDFIHHFAEKFGLLGTTALNDVTQYFDNIGLGYGFMITAGLCEFAAFVGFTFGLFTRFAAVGTALYLIICLYCGHHYLSGFTWVDHTTAMINGRMQEVYGGWEFPLFWGCMCLSFVLTGGRQWSLDKYIRDNTRNRFINILCG